MDDKQKDRCDGGLRNGARCTLARGHDGPHRVVLEDGEAHHLVSQSRARECAVLLLEGLDATDFDSIEIIAGLYEAMAMIAGMAFEGGGLEAWNDLAQNKTLRAAFVVTFDASKLDEGAGIGTDLPKADESKH